MSRSGYSEDLDNWDLIRWRGQVVSAIRGRRGQKLLIDLRAALLAMPEKRLISSDLIRTDGEVCTLGALSVARGIDMSNIDPDDPDVVAEAFDVAPQLAREIAYMNDEYNDRETPEERYRSMLAWVDSHIAKQAAIVR